MATNLGNISNLLSTPTAQIDDGNDAIHSAIIMYLNAASGENRAISGFDITQGTTSSHTHYAVTAGSILRNGKLVSVNSSTLTTSSSTGTSNSVDWYGVIVVQKSDDTLAWRHGTSSPTTTGKLDTSTATVAALTTGDIPIAVVKYAASSAADVTSRPMQFLGYKPLNASNEVTREFSTIDNGTEKLRLNKAGTLTYTPSSTAYTLTLPSATGTLARTADNITGTAAGLSATLGVSSGGTGQTTYTNGQLLIGNTTGNTLTKATLTGGSNITITNGAGSISIAGTANDDVSKTNLTSVLATYTGDDTLTIGDSGDDTSVVIKGNLEVKGTTTTVNTQTINAQDAIVFEGATADDHETKLTITDPTADRTITLPDASGTVSLRTDAEIKALVGAMFTSNTETRISATYQSSDNTIDLVVDDMNDSVRTVTAGGNTLATNESLDFVAGTNVTISESGGDVTIAASDPNVDIDGLTPESGIHATNDTLAFYDATASANRKITLTQLMAATSASMIPTLPADKIGSGTFAAARIPTLAQSKVTDLETDLAAKVPTTRTIAGRALSNNLAIRVNTSTGKLEVNDGSNTTTIQDTAGSPVDVIFDNRKTEYDEIQDANNTKPADNATVGARLGTNLKAADGSTTLGDADVKNASIASTHVVGSGKLFTTTLPEDGATTGKLFFQASVPTAKTVGDLWFDSDDSNRMYIAASATADQITSGEWESIGFPAGEAGATANTINASSVTAAGALMDSELTSIADVKALDQSVISGASPTFSTANFTDASNKRLMTDAQETKLDSVESSADVTDTANVTAAGALMDSEVTNLAFVKGLASGISDGNVLVANANVADNDFLRVDGTSIEGRTAAEVRSDLSLGAAALKAVATDGSGGVADGEGGLVTGNAVFDYIAAQNFASSGASNFVVGDITGQTALTSGLASTDEFIISDAGALKRMDTSVLQAYMQSNLTFTTNTNTQNEYATSFVDSTNDIILRLTESGAGSGTQDIKFVAGSNITLTHTDANNITIASTDTNTNTNQLTTFTLTGDSGTNQTIAHGNTLDIAGGDGIATVVGNTDTVTIGLDIDGMSDINAALVDADLMIVDDGAGGTNKKATMSRLKTYMQNNLTFTTNTNTQLSDSQVETAYNNQVSAVTSQERTDGTVTAIRRFTPADIHSMIDTHQSDTNTNQLTTFTLAGDSGTSQTIAHGNTLTVTGGNAIDTAASNTDTITINHADTSSQASVNNSGRTYIQDITLDTYGHITGITSATESVTNTDVNVNVSNLTARLPQITEDVTIGDATDVTVTMAGDLTVTGDLLVSGDTVTVNTATLSVEDPLVYLANGQSGTPSVDIGIIGERGSSTNVGFIWDESADTWSAITTTDTGTTAGNVTIAGYANLKAATITGSLTGDVTGKADTADTLETARTIFGHSFDGSANLTGTIDNAYIASGLSATKLTTGTIPASRIGTGAISTARLADDAVTNAKVGANAIDTTELADNAVESDQINANAVVEAKIADDAVTGAKVSGFAIANAQVGVGTLSLELGSSATTLTLSSSSEYNTFPATGVVQIGSEVIKYTGKTGVSLTGLVRGHKGTSAATHSANASVKTEPAKQITLGGSRTLEVKQFEGADSSNATDLAGGLVPYAGTGDVAKFLRGDGAWVTLGGGSGTVTSVTAGDGMTQSGTNTVNPTLDVVGGTGITANANDIAVTAAQTGITSILNTSLAVGRDAHNQIKFSTDDQIIFRVGNADGVTFKTSGEIEATSLDISGDADIDGTLEADAITIGGTAIAAAGTTSITTLGTIGTGTWQGTAIASAYLDADTAHLSGTQTFSGAKTFSNERTIFDEKISSSGTNTLQLETNNGVNSGTIKILNGGVANHINIEPASGTVNLNAETIRLSNAGASTITTAGAYDLTLNTNDGTNSGSIVIVDGANSDISITPNGTGQVNLGNFQFDVDQTVGSGQDNYVLTYDHANTQISLEAAGGVTFPLEADSGSAGAPSYSFSADTDTGIYLSGASNMSIVAGSNSYLSIGSLGAVQFDRKALFNVATEAAPNAFATDTNTGFFQAAADTISLSNAGSETFRFGSSGEILIGGSAAGSSGQVLTSGGSGAAVTWSTISSGASAIGDLSDAITTATSNIGLGSAALDSLTASSGNYNVALGVNAGTAITTGDNSVAIGYNALKSTTTQNEATAVGYLAAEDLAGGTFGTSAFGVRSLSNFTTGWGNTGIGHEALYSQEAAGTGSTNTAVGYQAMRGGTSSTAISGSQNTAVGGNALEDITSGAANVAIGYQSLTNVTSGSYNIGLGMRTGQNTTTGTRNIAIGDHTFKTNSTGTDMVAIGHNAAEAATAGFSVVIGSLAQETGTGSYNVYAGYRAGYDSDSTQSVALGYGAAEYLDGGNSVAIGLEALKGSSSTHVTGVENVALGFMSGGSVSTGRNNTLIGTRAGDSLTSGDGNVIIGSHTEAASNTGDLQLTIGSHDGSNSVTWITGNSSGGINSKAEVVAVSSNTTLTLAQTGAYIYWTSGTLTLPASGTVGTQYTVINNTGGSATVAVNASNCSMVAGFTGATNATTAISDHELASFVCVTANTWIQVG